MEAATPVQPDSPSASTSENEDTSATSSSGEGPSGSEDQEEENSDQGSLDSDAQEEKNKELMEAARDGSIDRARAALNSGADIDWMDYSRCPWEATPVLEAVTMGHRKLANFLIDKGADPDISDYRENTPLLLAAAAGWPDVVENLVRSGATVNHKNNDKEDAFSFAFEAWGDHSREDMESVLSHLLSGQPKEQLVTALGDAVDLKLYDAVSTFLDHDETLASERIDGAPLLRFAATDDATDLVKRLLELGASVTEEDSGGTTDLWNAVMNTKVETTKLLLQHGSEPNTSSDGISLLANFCDTSQSIHEENYFPGIALMLMKSGARTSYHLLGDEARSSIKNRNSPLSRKLEERMTGPASLQEQAGWRVRQLLREGGKCRGRSIVDTVASLNLSGIVSDFILLKHL